MKLYYSPGACSLSPHIVAREGKLPVELSRVTFDGAVRTTAEGEDFFVVNPKGGYVPALRLDSGEVLAEGVAIIQYLADQSSETLTPEKGSMDYYRMLEWLTFISSEIHKGFSPLYNPAITDEAKEAQIKKIFGRLTFVEAELGNHSYLIGDALTLPDAYLYTILRWSKKFAMDLSGHPNISAFMARMDAREGVKEALKEEGLEAFTA
ncbi:MAG: glutathione transferase GstA [Parcubacteria group bacterium]|nr:glutathione transferase GstA [Parcubacteria group bacterium]